MAILNVILREHLYRGEQWAIAYWSVPEITKEGMQQITMPVTVSMTISTIAARTPP